MSDVVKVDLEISASLLKLAQQNSDSRSQLESLVGREAVNRGIDALDIPPTVRRDPGLAEWRP